MLKYYMKILSLFLLIFTLLLGTDYSHCEDANEHKVTFIELGSAKCIPCKMMKPIIEEIKKEYPDVNVLFYDVKTSEGREYSSKYGIRLIPTQIFLDKDGKEYFRHEGFFPKEEIEKTLKQKGAVKKED